MYEPPKNWTRLAYRVGDAAKVLGVSRPEFDAIVTAGELEVVQAGRRKVVLAEDLFAFIDHHARADRSRDYDECVKFYERLVNGAAS